MECLCRLFWIELDGLHHVSRQKALGTRLDMSTAYHPQTDGQKNSYVYNPNPISFDCLPDSYHPPHPTYETYSYDSYGNNSQFGYDCQPQFLFNYESEPGYNENYTSYPYDSSSLPQQYLCCARCGGPHETCQCEELIFDEPYCKHCGGPHMNYQCQSMNQDSYNSNSLGFDQPQPPQSLVIHQPPQELSIQEMDDLKQQYLDELKRLSNLEYRDEVKIAELTKNFNGVSIEIRKKEKLLQQEQWAYLSTHPSKRLHSFCFDDDDAKDYTSAITPDEPVLSTEEPDNSLKYDCFLFKVEPNSRDFTKDVVEDISPTKEPQVLSTLLTHPTLQLNMKFQPFSESLFTYVVKEYQEKDKIGSKPDKNGKCGEAGKSQEQLQ
nr:hypothetical protein [Tanacetum cinerariifolium]